MKRYLVFVGDVYYPKPGMGDFIGDAVTRVGAEALVAQAYAKVSPTWHSYMWSYIWDSKTRAEIKEAV